MNSVLVTVLAIALIELAIRLPFPAILATVRKTGLKTMHVLVTGAISDHWKEKVMLAYAGTMFLSSIKLAVLLLLLGALGTVLTLAFTEFSNDFGEYLLSGRGIVASMIAAVIYLVVRKKFTEMR